jgi:hypothetical protein
MAEQSPYTRLQWIFVSHYLPPWTWEIADIKPFEAGVKWGGLASIVLGQCSGNTVKRRGFGGKWAT